MDGSGEGAVQLVYEHNGQNAIYSTNCTLEPVQIVYERNGQNAIYSSSGTGKPVQIRFERNLLRRNLLPATTKQLPVRGGLIINGDFVLTFS